MGDIFLAEMSGELKMTLPASPGPGFKIKFIYARPSDGFIVADNSGKFKIYQSSGEPKQPYCLYRDLPTCADPDEHWLKYLKRLEYEPYFPITGAFVQGDYIVYAT